MTVTAVGKNDHKYKYLPQMPVVSVAACLYVFYHLHQEATKKPRNQTRVSLTESDRHPAGVNKDL